MFHNLNYDDKQIYLYLIKCMRITLINKLFAISISKVQAFKYKYQNCLFI